VGSVGFGSLDTADTGNIGVHSGNMFENPVPTGATVALSAVTLLNPTQPAKFIALWNNFHELAAKLNQKVPEEPLYLIKAPSACLEPDGRIFCPPHYDGKIVYEGELGVVIGKRCRNVTEAEAPSCIFGYTCVNDVTAFDIISCDPAFAQWTRAKSFDTFAPFGPAVATGLNWSALRIRTLVNGCERQNYPASDMIIPPARIVSLISRELTFEPGDVIACGTSVGVSAMRPGSKMEVVIEGIGTLSNTYE
jgi:2-keto-4-pentenoate hydratase/2-oxohepta-3-ene-1,7-dioic acid hydratase in catechol pathway